MGADSGRKDGPVRLKDIAKDLGVSVVTVSKVLRNHDDISAAMKARVRERMRQLNYQPNWIARSLATQRTYIIGLVIPDLSHTFFSEIAKVIGRAVRSQGYEVLISYSEEVPRIEREAIDRLLHRRVDGLILASSLPPRDTRVFELMDRNHVPYVLLDRAIPSLAENYVGNDNEAIGELATEHLIKVGCRRIAHMRGPELTTGIGRFNGYRNALSRHGLEMHPHYVTGKESTLALAAGRDPMHQLLRLNPALDGVFCHSDGLAVGAMQAILESGRKIPANVAVVGVGNIRFSDSLVVPLTTVDQSCAQMGKSAAALMLKLIQSKREQEWKPIIVPIKLIVRESTVSPPERDRGFLPQHA